METTLRAPSLCPDVKVKEKRPNPHIERHDVSNWMVERRKFTFFAIQRTLSSWPFRILQMRTGCAEGSSGLHRV